MVIVINFVSSRPKCPKIFISLISAKNFQFEFRSISVEIQDFGRFQPKFGTSAEIDFYIINFFYIFYTYILYFLFFYKI